MRATALNQEVARLSGIRTNFTRTLSWAISGAASSLAGLLITPTSNLSPNTLDLVLIIGFTAAVVGGVSLFGGKGRLSQAVIGGFVIAIIDNGLGLMGFNAGINLLITGGVLLLAASADAISRKRGNVVVR